MVEGGGEDDEDKADGEDLLGDVSVLNSRVSIVVKRTKDKTMIVLTPAMVAVGCAEVGGLVDSR